MLEVQGVQKYFGDKHALQNITLTLPKGSVLGFIGRNGAGKTTFLRTLLGIYDLQQGSITWNGVPFHSSGITTGYLPEERGLFLKEKVFQQLQYLGMLSGLDKKECTKAIDFWLDRFGILEHRNKIAGELSKGNQQKVQLISALLHDPEFIVLDEPFSGLDPVNANQLNDILLELKNQGRTVVFSSHRMENVEQFCDQVFLIHRGKQMLSGAINEIKESYGYRIVQVKLADEQTLDDEKFEKKEDRYVAKIETTEEWQAIMNTFSLRTDIRELTIRYPSMQEIFVETVGDEK